MSGRCQQGRQRKAAGLRGRLGRMQPLVPSLLHVAVGPAESTMPALSEGMVGAAYGKIMIAIEVQNSVSQRKGLEYLSSAKFRF